MINSEVANMVRDFDNRLRQQGMNMDMFLSFSGQTREDLEGQMKSDAEKRVRNNLVLEVIAKEENIEVSEEEVNQELATMAESFKRSPEEIRSILAANGSLSSLSDEISLRKTIDLLIASSVEVEAAEEAPAAEEASAE
ncbi:Trigger factor [compost metagenome]